MLVDATVKLRSTAGTLLQDLSTGGYWVGNVDEPQFTRRRDQITSPFVSGWSTISAPKDGAVLAFPVRCEGATWAAVEDLRAALEGWMDTWRFKVEIAAEGVSTTYVAEVGDMAAAEPLDAPTIANCARTFVLSIPVQPYPVVA